MVSNVSYGRSFRMFLDLLKKYQSDMATSRPNDIDATKYMNHHERLTVFVPTKAAIEKIPSQTLSKLRNDAQTLQKVGVIIF